MKLLVLHNCETDNKLSVHWGEYRTSSNVMKSLSLTLPFCKMVIVWPLALFIRTCVGVRNKNAFLSLHTCCVQPESTIHLDLVDVFQLLVDDNKWKTKKNKIVEWYDVRTKNCYILGSIRIHSISIVQFNGFIWMMRVHDHIHDEGHFVRGGGRTSGHDCLRLEVR